MLTIYIVDDEPMAIRYLESLLGACGAVHEIIGSATNSHVALQEILRLKPDVVFTDISMPVMNGLTLARRVLEKLATRVYLLTSYEDFGFAREGVKLGAADYILKNELTEGMLRELLQKAEADISREQYSRRLVLESTARDFLLGAGDWPQPEQMGCRYTLLTFFEPVRFCMEHPQERSERLLDTEPLLALEWPEGLECLAFTRMRRGTWCAVIQVSASVVNGFRMVYKVSDQLLSGINAGESGWKCIQTQPLTRFEALRDAYRDSLAASERLYTCPEQDIFGLGDIALPDESEREEADVLLERIHQLLGAGSRDESIALTEQLFRLCRKKLGKADYEDRLRRLCQMIRRWGRRRLMNGESLILAGSYSNATNLERAVLNCEELYFENLERADGREYSEHVQRAAEYIRKNLDRDISVTGITEAIGISEGHLRRLFKQELGTSVIDYLTEARVERAKKLLESADAYPTELWKRCGFSSSQYFNQVFRKKEGLSPRDYWQRRGQSR